LGVLCGLECEVGAGLFRTTMFYSSSGRKGGALFFALSLCLVVAVKGTENSPEAEFRALKALGETQVPMGTAKLSEEEGAWLSARNLELHEQGLAFWVNYPDHPLRWDVWMLLSLTPTFSRESVEDGRITVVRDYERQRAWSRRYDEGLEELIGAPDASGSAKQRALSSLLTRNGMNWRGRIATPEGQRMLVKMTGWLEQWERDFPASLSILNGVRAVAEVLDVADPARCQQFLLNLPRRYAGDTARDRTIRAFAEGRLKLVLGQAYPVWLRLAALDGRFADTQEYRGKIVLVALFPVAWSAQVEFLRTLHGRFHTRGFEIIHVTGGDSMVGGETPRTALETAEIVDQADYPWRVAWDEKGTIGEVARSMGLNGYPTWLLLSRDGRFVAKTSSPREIVAALEAEVLIETEPALAPAAAPPAVTGTSETGYSR